MNTMTKAARRTAWLEGHYDTLERLARHCGVKAPNGKKLSVALLKLEREAHQRAEDYCNGHLDDLTWETVQMDVTVAVKALFWGNLPGFMVNGDPRGYALKIDPKAMPQYAKIGLHQDWGGYGILSPDATAIADNSSE